MTSYSDISTENAALKAALKGVAAGDYTVTTYTAYALGTGEELLAIQIDKAVDPDYPVAIFYTAPDPEPTP